MPDGDENSSGAAAPPFDPLRRVDLQQMTPLEQNIRHLVLEIEKLGADPRLTDCIVLLGQAREKLADYVDGVRP